MENDIAVSSLTFGMTHFVRREQEWVGVVGRVGGGGWGWGWGNPRPRPCRMLPRHKSLPDGRKERCEFRKGRGESLSALIGVTKPL